MALYVSEHNSPFVETVFKNGASKQVNYHIKTSPFSYKLALAPNCGFNFSTGSLQADLFFDLPEPKLVQTQKEKPFEYLMYPNDDGRSCAVQFRIHVLSTQNQGMHFKIRIRLAAGAACGSASSKFLEVWTDSIKVVAKLDSIRKKQAEREGANVAPRKNKRARSDDLLDSLASIQEQQRQQADLLNSLLVRMANSPSTSCLSSDTSARNCSVSVPTPLAPPSSSLETAFQQFLLAYEQVDVEERPRKMRRVCEDLSDDRKKAVSEIGCVFAAYDSKPSVSQVASSAPSPDSIESFLLDDSSFEEAPSCNFLPNGEDTHQRELENWNHVLHEFLMQDDDA